MIRVVLGIAVGYVLGAKAGRKRYDQIVRMIAKLRSSTAIQAGAGYVAAKVVRLLPGRQEPRKPDMAYLPDDEQPVDANARPAM